MSLCGGICSHSVLQCHEASQTFAMVCGHVRELTLQKTSKYGEYGSFEHLLPLFTHDLLWKLTTKHHVIVKQPVVCCVSGSWCLTRP